MEWVRLCETRFLVWRERIERRLRKHRWCCLCGKLRLGMAWWVLRCRECEFWCSDDGIANTPWWRGRFGHSHQLWEPWGFWWPCCVVLWWKFEVECGRKCFGVVCSWDGVRVKTGVFGLSLCNPLHGVVFKPCNWTVICIAVAVFVYGPNHNLCGCGFPCKLTWSRITYVARIRLRLICWTWKLKAVRIVLAAPLYFSISHAIIKDLLNLKKFHHLLPEKGSLEGCSTVSVPILADRGSAAR